MKNRHYPALYLLAATLLLQGCAPLIVAGAATTAVVAYDRRTVGAFIDDNNIELKVRAILTDDKLLGDNVHINATSINGTVLLTGETPTEALRARLIDQIRDIPSVRRIVNEIRVAELSDPNDRSRDAWLTSKVKAKLMASKGVSAPRIKVVTENSSVYLMGLVTRQEAEKSTEVTRKVGGVERVVKLFEYID